MSTYSPAVSKRFSTCRSARPLSMTWVIPWDRGLDGRAGRSRKPLKPGIQVLQSLLRCLLHVVEERRAVGVDADGEWAEILDPELPKALGHELFPGHLFDLLDLRGLERRRPADDREVNHAELLHGLDRLVGKPPLAADGATAVVAAGPLRQAPQPRARGWRCPDAAVLSES